MILTALSKRVARWARRTLLKRPASELAAARSFSQLWSQLICETRPWAVLHLDLEVNRRQQSVWQQTWSSRGPAARLPDAWTVCLELQGRNGFVYELRVALDEASRDDHHSLARLVSLLSRFLQSTARYGLAAWTGDEPLPTLRRTPATGGRLRGAA